MSASMCGFFIGTKPNDTQFIFSFNIEKPCADCLCFIILNLFCILFGCVRVCDCRCVKIYLSIKIYELIVESNFSCVQQNHSYQNIEN